MSREFEASIVDLSHDGRGVARREGKTVFVSGALPGERVRARQTGRRRSFDEAVTLEVLERAPDRVEPRCPHFGQCGGCTLQHMDSQRQIQAKQRVLVENLARIGHVEAASVLAPLTGEPWGYRRKARLGVKWVEKKGRAVVGFREAGNPRFIADLSRCEVLVPAVGERIAAISALVSSLEARAQLPQIEVAAGDDTVALVFRHLQPLSDDDRRKLADFGRTHGFTIFLQPGGVDSVHALWPESPSLPPILEFSIAGHDLRLAFLPLDFVQVNASMNHRMVDHALALLDPQPTDRVLDLFCGLGNFTLPVARRAGVVVGVEGETGLVQRARANAVANSIDNAQFHVADLAADLRGEPWYGQGFDRILLDPPRSGAEAVVRSLPLEAARRIVYVSCHPGSLARDAGILVHERGFVLRAAGVMDMFPHTAHVESIAMFERS